MRNLKPTKAVLSAYSVERSPNQNKLATCELACDLAAADYVDAYREVTGRFDGFDEESFVCWLRPGSILEGLDEIVSLARSYQQNTVLVIHGDDAAELVETETDCSAILGTFQAAVPKPGEDYTLVDSTFYVVR